MKLQRWRELPDCRIDTYNDLNGCEAEMPRTARVSRGLRASSTSRTSAPDLGRERLLQKGDAGIEHAVVHDRFSVYRTSRGPSFSSRMATGARKLAALMRGITTSGQEQVDLRAVFFAERKLPRILRLEKVVSESAQDRFARRPGPALVFDEQNVSVPRSVVGDGGGVRVSMGVRSAEVNPERRSPATSL